MAEWPTLSIRGFYSRYNMVKKTLGIGILRLFPMSSYYTQSRVFALFNYVIRQIEGVFNPLSSIRNAVSSDKNLVFCLITLFRKGRKGAIKRVWAVIFVIGGPDPLRALALCLCRELHNAFCKRIGAIRRLWGLNFLLWLVRDTRAQRRFRATTIHPNRTVRVPPQG